MVICICGCVNEAEVRAEIKSGNNTMNGLRLALGVCNVCESCNDTLEAMLEESEQDADK